MIIIIINNKWFTEDCRLQAVPLSNRWASGKHEQAEMGLLTSARPHVQVACASRWLSYPKEGLLAIYGDWYITVLLVSINVETQSFRNHYFPAPILLLPILANFAQSSFHSLYTTFNLKMQVLVSGVSCIFVIFCTLMRLCRTSCHCSDSVRCKYSWKNIY